MTPYGSAVKCDAIMGDELLQTTVLLNALHWRHEAGARQGTCPLAPAGKGWPGGRSGLKLIQLTQRLNDFLQ